MGVLREGCPNEQVFVSLADARIKFENGRIEYNRALRGLAAKAA